MKTNKIKTVLNNIRSSLRARIPVFFNMLTPLMVVCMAQNAYATDVLNSATTILAGLVESAGGLIGAWGLVILGSNLKDHNGPGINNGAWTIIGGAVIFAAGAVIRKVT